MIRHRNIFYTGDEVRIISMEQAEASKISLPLNKEEEKYFCGNVGEVVDGLGNGTYVVARGKNRAMLPGAALTLYDVSFDEAMQGARAMAQFCFREREKNYFRACPFSTGNSCQDCVLKNYFPVAWAILDIKDKFGETPLTHDEANFLQAYYDNTSPDVVGFIKHRYNKNNKAVIISAFVSSTGKKEEEAEVCIPITSSKDDTIFSGMELDKFYKPAQLIDTSKKRTMVDFIETGDFNDRYR